MLTSNWVSLVQARDNFGVSEATLRNWLRKGLIEGKSIELVTGKKWLVNPQTIQVRLPQADEVTNNQAAVILGITNSRVTQLVNAGKLEVREGYGKKHIKTSSVMERKLRVG